MAFIIEYRRGNENVAEIHWPTPIPPTRDFAYQGLLRHDADSANILDDEGNVLARETRWSKDA